MGKTVERVGREFDRAWRGHQIRHAVYYHKEDVPRRPAYAIGEKVWTPSRPGRVMSSNIAHCGPGGGWMWVYDLWMYDMRVPEERRAVWEEDIRPLFKEGE